MYAKQPINLYTLPKQSAIYIKEHILNYAAVAGNYAKSQLLIPQICYCAILVNSSELHTFGYIYTYIFVILWSFCPLMMTELVTSTSGGHPFK